MDHIRAPPTNWHNYTTMNGHCIVTMKGQHTWRGVLPSLFLLN
ncbi:MAG: hypothetical protein ACXVCM_10595 [Ktedonobacteraceae bacterium]